MKDDAKFEADDGLKDLGRRISALSRPTPPENLAAKTAAYVQANCPPKKRIFWLLRPITNPAARVAAAAIIVLILSPLTDLDMGANIGARIEQKVIGTPMTDKLEAFVDQVLPPGSDSYSQPYFDSFMGVNRPSAPRRATKQANHRV